MPDLHRAAFVLLLAFAAPLTASEPEAPAAVVPAVPVAPAAATDEPPSLSVPVPAGTELVFEMGASLTSKTSQRGDRFPLRLAQPLRIDGHLLVPAGTPAMGEVVHADRARSGGQAGEMILAARYLEWDGRQLPLKAFSAGVGKDRSKTSAGVMAAVGLAGYFVRGGNLEMAEGTLITAKLRDMAELPALPEPVEPVEAAAVETPAAPETPATPAAPTTTATPDATESTTGENQE